MNIFTVFVREHSNTGTTYITSVEAKNMQEASDLAEAECRENWGGGGIPWQGRLHILGVARGEVDIIEWDDQV